MARKRLKQRKSSFAAKAAVMGIASCLLAGCVGFGFASADVVVFDADDLLGSLTVSYVAPEDDADFGNVSDTSSSEKLTETSARDISEGIAAIEAEEEAARIAAEEAAAAEEQAAIEAAEKAKAKWEKKIAKSKAYDSLSTLSEVDWSVGEEEFLAEWTERIDDYLKGSPLAGYGATFAAAAWEYGVDPRFSPAIANTESTKGRYCFEDYNAWGWMDDEAWDSWDEAIYAHVEGLADGYGYSITLSGAMKYCPPTYESWFKKTLRQMKKI